MATVSSSSEIYVAEADVMSIQSTPWTEVRVERGRWIALVGLLLASFMDALQTQVMIVVVPVVQRDLHASPAVVQWATAGYILAFGLMLAPGGRMGDLFGRKRMFLLGTGGYVVLSLLTGLAVNGEMLVIARVLQGVLAGLMVPQVLTLIQVNFSGADRAKALGMMASVPSLAGVGGPIVGGLIGGANWFGLGWRPIFLINIPIGIVCFLMTVRLVRESRSDDRRGLDLFGAVILAAGLLGLLYPLVQGSKTGWPAWTYACLAAGVVILLLFAVHERIRGNAGRSVIVEPSLFRQPSFVGGLLVSMVIFAGTSVFFVLSLFEQFALQYSPIATGLSFLPFSAGLILGVGLAMRLVHTLGRKIVAIGSLIVAAGMAAMSLTVHYVGAALTVWHLVPSTVVAGFGIALAGMTVMTIALSRVPPQHAGSASGAINTAFQIGPAIGIAVVGTVYFTVVSGGGQLAAVQHSLWWVVGMMVLAFLLTFLLPKGQIPDFERPDLFADTGPRA
jgi:EmrB/QacA subfamily drug resistance transporter